ncbi:MAG: lipopolysaccharide heptosyltransferase family protein [Bryobacterales bacterium]|nr:lipopolysaccharide heptosyltransferase family protein [Bryobacterales bacterium]
MENILERLPEGARVALIRLRSLGDCVLTTPALQILRRFRPDLRVGVAVETPFAAVFEGNSDVDSLLAPSAAAVRAWRPELCLNLHGGTRSAQMIAFSGARYRAGFGHYRFPWLYNIRIPRAQEILGVERTVHTAEHVASALFYLGAPRVEIPRARLFARRGPARAPYAVIHPLASRPDKVWPKEKFLEVAAALPFEVVFIGGPGDDLTHFSKHRTVSGSPLSETKQLIQGASLFLGNDSGPAHIAAAFGVPLVVLFGSSNPAIWAPWRAPSEVLTDLDRVSVDQVLSAVSRLQVHA